MKRPYPLIIFSMALFLLASGCLSQPDGISDEESQTDPVIFEYIERGDVEGLKKYLLTDSPQVNLPDSQGSYPLHRAVEKNNYPIVQILLTSGSQYNVTNASGETPLLISAKRDNRDLVDLFLKWDADPLISDNDGSYPLHFGVTNNNLSVVKELVPVMDDPDRVNGEGKSGLYLAVDAGYRDIASYLIAQGADIFFASGDGTTPADLVINKKNAALTKAVVNPSNYRESFSHPFPLLHRFIEKGDYSLCEYLNGLDGGAVNIEDAEGKLPLDIALSYKTSYDHARIAEYLVDRGSKRSNLKEFSYVTDLFRNDDALLDLGEGMTPLHTGSLLGHQGLVELMVRKFNPDTNVKDTAGGTPLLYAVRGGHEKIASLLIDNGADINNPDNYDKTPVHAAIALVNYDAMLNLLIERGGNINQQDIQGNTALHLAVQYGLSLDIVKTLIELGSDPNIRNSEGSIPLIYALLANQEDIMIYLTPLSDIFAVNLNDQSAVLLALSGDMAMMDNFFTPRNLALQDVEGNSVLHYAATYPLDELAEEKMVFMVERGADPNLRNARGMTPLHSAIESFYWKTANTLTGLGADMFLSNNAGETALHMAFVRGSDFSIRFLTDGNDLLEETDLSGNTPLFHAVREYHLPLIKLLLSEGADYSHANLMGQTPLFVAVEENSLESLELLLDGGASLLVTDKNGNTPLHFLVLREKINWMVGDILLEGGVSTDSKNSVGITALHRAAEKGSLDGCTYLLDRGAKVDPVDDNGFTPLFYSIMKGSTEIASFLLERGAGINKRDLRGNTVLHASVLQDIGREKGDMINLLLDKSADIFASNKVGDTPLSLAIEVGPVTLDSLLRKDTINAINNEGDTPLHFALSLRAEPAVIEILLSEGADKEAINGRGLTPLQVAENQGYDSYIISILDTEEGE